MSRVATVVPAEDDLLCEGCGYTLNGLPQTGNCPECGKPIEQSLGEHRHLSEFESKPSPRSFVRTSLSLIFRPRFFFSHLYARSDTSAAKTFATINLVLCSLLFSFALLGHGRNVGIRLAPIFLAAFFPVLLILLTGLTRLAAWLSAIEAKYWGMRLPYLVVMRGLTFHTVHYLPVACAANVVIWGYRWLIKMRILDLTTESLYLYTLCGLVIVGAIYLFQTYWIAMRSLMYANR